MRKIKIGLKVGKKIQKTAAALVLCIGVFCTPGLVSCGRNTDIGELEIVESDGSDQGSHSDIIKEDPTDNDTSELSVVVHVCGCVNAPGLYELPAGSRIGNAIESAGGFSCGADEVHLNLAELLTDGQQVYVPSEGEAGSEDVSSHPAGSTDDGKVNINTADRNELMSIPGIGGTRADNIIAYRNTHGYFADIKDIMKVTGIKEGIFAGIEEYLKI